MPTRVTIACSGLGHIRRGNETWALDTASALHAAGVDVLLCGGGPRPETDCPYARLPNLRRDFPLLRRWLPWSRRYLLEQLTFLLALRQRLHRDRRRLVHLCDPDLAWQLHKRTPRRDLRLAFKDGMFLGPPWCRRLEFVQVLAPYYRDHARDKFGVDVSRWFVIPHGVDSRVFQPPNPAERTELRRARPDLRLADDAFVVLGLGDFSPASRKRLDWLVREVAALPASLHARLILAGQSSPEDFAAFARNARELLGDRVTVLRNLARDQVARLLQVADVFAHAALREPFGIVFLEAMATGLPVVGHDWDVTRWIVGDAGTVVDMEQPSALSGVLRRWAEHPAERLALGRRARERVLASFELRGLVPRYRELYAGMERAFGSPAESPA